jgi:HEAT repeat protein
MAPTLSDVRRYLDPDQVDYAGAAAELGAQALPLLEELVRGDDPMLASKAAYLASLIPAEGRLAVLGAAATSPHAAVRVSAASALRNLGEEDADALAGELLSDVDVGVRKLTVRAAASFGSARMTERLRKVSTEDSDETLRRLAADALQASRVE